MEIIKGGGVLGASGYQMVIRVQDLYLPTCRLGVDSTNSEGVIPAYARGYVDATGCVTIMRVRVSPPC